MPHTNKTTCTSNSPGQILIVTYIIPHLYLLSSIGFGETGAIYNFDTKAVLKSNGYTEWFAPTEIHSICKININYFPFDEQACPLVFGSWTYTGEDSVIQLVLRGQHWGFDKPEPSTTLSSAKFFWVLSLHVCFFSVFIEHLCFCFVLFCTLLWSSYLLSCL